MLVLNAYVQNPPLNANASRRNKNGNGFACFTVLYRREVAYAQATINAKLSCVGLNCFLHVAVHMYIQQDSG